MAELEQAGPLKHLHKQQQTTQSIEADALDQLTNLYCELRAVLDPKLAEIKIEQKELEEVEKQLQVSLDEHYPANLKSIRKTLTWLLSFGYKGKATEVTDKYKIREILGDDAFMAIVNVPIGEVEKYLTAKQLAEVTQEVHKHKRRLTYAKVTG